MTLRNDGAVKLATITKTVPMWDGISPRWLLRMLPWVDVTAGGYRINRVTNPASVVSEHTEGTELPLTAANYDAKPREWVLTSIQNIVQVHTRTVDLYNSPHDQLREALRLGIEAVMEEKERLVLNSAAFGLLSQAAPSMRIAPESGPPTPNDLDNLLERVWKKPAFFVAHPKALAAFGHECTARGLTLEAVEIFGVPFVTWRGVPILPSDKLPVVKGKGGSTTSILLLRVGEQDQGVVGIHQADLGDEHLPSLSVRSLNVDLRGVDSYLVTAYVSTAVLVDDALGVLQNVKV